MKHRPKNMKAKITSKSKKNPTKFQEENSFKRTIDAAINKLSSLQVPPTPLGRVEFRLDTNVVNTFKNLPPPSPPKVERPQADQVLKKCTVVTSTPYCGKKNRISNGNCSLGSPIQLATDQEDAGRPLERADREDSSIIYVGTEQNDPDATLKKSFKSATATSPIKPAGKGKSGIPVLAKFPVKNRRSRSQPNVSKEKRPKSQSEEDSPDRKKTIKKRRNGCSPDCYSFEDDFSDGNQNEEVETSLPLEKSTGTEPFNAEAEPYTSPSSSTSSQNRSRAEARQEDRTKVSPNRSRTVNGKRHDNMTVSNAEMNANSIAERRKKTICDERAPNLTHTNYCKEAHTSIDRVNVTGGAIPTTEIEHDGCPTSARSSSKRNRSKTKTNAENRSRTRSNKRNQSGQTDFNGDVEHSVAERRNKTICDDRGAISTQTKVSQEVQTSIEKCTGSRTNTAESQVNSIVEEIQLKIKARETRTTEVQTSFPSDHQHCGNASSCRIGQNRVASPDKILGHVDQTVNREWTLKRKKQFQEIISKLEKFALESKEWETTEVQCFEKEETSNKTTLGPLFRRSALKASNATTQPRASGSTKSDQSTAGLNIYDSVKDVNLGDSLQFSVDTEDTLVKNKENPWRFSSSIKSSTTNIILPNFILSEAQMESSNERSFRSTLDTYRSKKRPSYGSTQKNASLSKRVLQYSNDEDSEVENCEPSNYQLAQNGHTNLSVKHNLKRRDYARIRRPVSKTSSNDEPDVVAENRRNVANQANPKKSVAKMLDMSSTSVNSNNVAQPAMRTRSQEILERARRNIDEKNLICSRQPEDDKSSDEGESNNTTKKDDVAFETPHSSNPQSFNVETNLKSKSKATKSPRKEKKSISKTRQPATSNDTHLEATIWDEVEIPQESFNNNEMPTASNVETNLKSKSKTSKSTRKEKRSKSVSKTRQPATSNDTHLEATIQDEVEVEIPQESFKNNQRRTASNVETNLKSKSKVSKSTRKEKRSKSVSKTRRPATSNDTHLEATIRDDVEIPQESFKNNEMPTESNVEDFPKPKLSPKKSSKKRDNVATSNYTHSEETMQDEVEVEIPQDSFNNNQRPNASNVETNLKSKSKERKSTRKEKRSKSVSKTRQPATSNDTHLEATIQDEVEVEIPQESFKNNEMPTESNTEDFPKPKLSPKKSSKRRDNVAKSNHTHLEQTVPNDVEVETPISFSATDNDEETSPKSKSKRSKSTRKKSKSVSKTGQEAISNNNKTQPKQLSKRKENDVSSNVESQTSVFSSDDIQMDNRDSVLRKRGRKNSTFDAAYPQTSISMANVLPSEGGRRVLRERVPMSVKLKNQLPEQSKGAFPFQILFVEPFTLTLKKTRGKSTYLARKSKLSRVEEHAVETDQPGPSSSCLMPPPPPPPPPRQSLSVRVTRLDEITADSGFENSNSKRSHTKNNTVEQREKSRLNLGIDDVSRPTGLSPEPFAPTFDDPDSNRDLTQSRILQHPENDNSQRPMQLEISREFNIRKPPPYKAYKKSGNLYLYESENLPDGTGCGYIKVKSGTTAESSEPNRNMTFTMIKGSKCMVQLKNLPHSAQLSQGYSCFIPKGIKYKIENSSRGNVVLLYRKS